MAVLQRRIGAEEDGGVAAAAATPKSFPTAASTKLLQQQHRWLLSEGNKAILQSSPRPPSGGGRIAIYTAAPFSTLLGNHSTPSTNHHHLRTRESRDCALISSDSKPSSFPFSFYSTNDVLVLVLATFGQDWQDLEGMHPPSTPSNLYSSHRNKITLPCLLSSSGCIEIEYESWMWISDKKTNSSVCESDFLLLVLVSRYMIRVKHFYQRCILCYSGRVKDE